MQSLLLIDIPIIFPTQNTTTDSAKCQEKETAAFVHLNRIEGDLRALQMSREETCSVKIMAIIALCAMLMLQAAGMGDAKYVVM